MQHSNHIVLPQCQVIQDRPSEQEIGNNSIVIVTAIGSQPCSLIQQWVSSPGHVVVVDDHAGCARAAGESDQLILRLIQNGSCSQHAQQQSVVELQGHLAESFEAFAKLSLRLYRGPNAVPQAKTGKASTLLANDISGENSSTTADARIESLHLPLPVPSQSTYPKHGETASLG